MLDIAVVLFSWAIDIVNFALNPGSSQHGNAVLAWVGSKLADASNLRKQINWLHHNYYNFKTHSLKLTTKCINFITSLPNKK